MKNAMRILSVALLSVMMMACGNGNKELTYNDLKKAEASLFNEDGSINESEAPAVAETYCKFVEQHPDDSIAPTWLYHAFEVNVMTKNAEKSIELCDKMLAMYPQSEWTPKALYLLGSFVYEEQLKDLKKARATYQRVISDYPESDLVPSVQASIKYLGKTPEEIMTLIQMSQMEEEAEE